MVENQLAGPSSLRSTSNLEMKSQRASSHLPFDHCIIVHNTSTSSS